MMMKVFRLVCLILMINGCHIDTFLLASNGKLRFDNNNEYLSKQMNLSQRINSNILDTPDVSSSVNNCKFKTIISKKSKHEIELSFTNNLSTNLSLISQYEMSLKDITLSSVAYGYGVEGHKKVFFNRIFQLYLVSGIGYELSILNYSGTFSNEGCAYIDTDSDGDVFYKFVKLNQLHENVKLKNGYIPLGVKILFPIEKTMGIYSSVGMKFYYLLSANSKVKAKSAQYSSFYPQYDDLYLTKNGYYDNGFFENLNSQMSLFMLPKFNFGIYARIGFKVNLGNKYSLNSDIGIEKSKLRLTHNQNDYRISMYYKDDKFDYNSLIYAFSNINKSSIVFNISFNRIL